MSRIAVIGLVGESVFLSVDRHQAVGETAHATSIHREWGGKGYNQAVAAARYGADVSFLGAASARDADAIVSAALADGVRAVIIEKPEATAYGVIVTDKTGDNRVTVYGGASLAADDVDAFRKEIENADILIINNEVAEDVNVAAVKIAKAAGVRVIYNPAPMRRICEYLCANTDIFTPNEHEAEEISAFENAIVTLGDKGCLIKWTGANLPAMKVDKVVDTTGAGDTFTGVLAASMAEGCDAYDACRAAIAASSIEVTRRFVMPAIPYRREVEDALSQE